MRTNPGGSTCSKNRRIRKGDESMAGNRYAMSVLAEIAKRVLGAAGRAFGVNHPLGAEERAKPGGEGLPILQRGQCSVELNFVFRMQRFEAIHELALEHGLEHIDRQEKFCCESIHRERSGANPPAATIQ
jgi:hypothetical protein